MEKYALVNIVCGDGKPRKWCNIIRSFQEITGESKKYYCSPNPCSITELDNRVFSADKSEIRIADLSKAEARLGTHYRIPNEYIFSL